MKKILVIGSFNMDIIMQVNELPKVGETIFSHNVEQSCGGKGANQAAAVGKLGGDIVMLGAVGSDAAGEIVLNNLKKCNVDTSCVIQMKDKNTGSAYITIDALGRNNIIVFKGANDCCDVNYLKGCEQQFQNADIVLISMEIPYDAVEYAVQKAKEYGCYCILNPAPAPDFLSETIIRNVDLLTPNETELMKLTGCDNNTGEGLEKGCNELLHKGLSEILVTLGEQGVMYMTEHQVKRIPAYQVKAVDTTAAGDSFNGALAVYLAEGHSIEEAIHFASLVSAIAVTQKGAQDSIPMRNDVKEETLYGKK